MGAATPTTSRFRKILNYLASMEVIWCLQFHSVCLLIILFLQGTGGHLHNLGVILKSKKAHAEYCPGHLPEQIGVTTNVAVQSRLLHLVDRFNLWNCGMLSYNQVCIEAMFHMSMVMAMVM